MNVLCVLLLLCSLSGAELQDNKIIEQRKVSPESVNVAEQPQPCPSDLHAVLRDISTKLGVLQTEMEQMQTLNQDVHAVLRDTSVKLAENRLMIQQLQTLNQKQAEKLLAQANTLTELQIHEVNPMKETLRGQAAELNNIKTRTDVTENHVDSLRTDRAVGQVAFSASLLASGEETSGPFNTNRTLVFRYVVSNIGNAYSPNTGFFTAPVRGAYHFEFYVYAVLDGSYGSGAFLVKNGKHVFASWERMSTYGGSTSSNGVTLLLEPGDVVFLRQFANTVITDNANRLSTLSGHLLFLM